MRKSYEKPMLYAEAFQMTEHIAGSCLTEPEFAALHNTPWTCAAAYNDERMFTTGIGACGVNGGTQFDEDIMMMDGFMDTVQLGSQCYNVFSAGNTMFSS